MSSKRREMPEIRACAARRKVLVDALKLIPGKAWDQDIRLLDFTSALGS